MNLGEIFQESSFKVILLVWETCKNLFYVICVGSKLKKIRRLACKGNNDISHITGIRVNEGASLLQFI